MANISTWLQALRLRTLPLSASVILAGSALVYIPSHFNWGIFTLSLTTAFLLQILSNLANDFGDFTAGTDDEGRLGPKRTMQQGLITRKQMMVAMVLTGLLSLTSGLSLLFISFSSGQTGMILLFLGLGLLCIAAAIKYTVGKSAYGYHGLGDIAVFLFFGGVGVLGTSYLHIQTFIVDFIWIAVPFGLLSAAVLNVNNMRDHVNDKMHNKNTLVVKIGLPAAKIYHIIIVSAAIICLVVFTLLYATKWMEFGFLIFSPVLVIHLMGIYKSGSEQLDPYLKKTALLTFFTSVFFFAGKIWATQC